MDAAFILTKLINLDIRLAIFITSWPLTYRAELISVLLALLISPSNCVVNLYSDCESVIKHFEHINNGGFLNIRNIFKQPHHKLWLSAFQEINQKQLKVVWHKVNSHGDNPYNNTVDQLARSTAYNHVAPVLSDICHDSEFYLPCWNYRLINLH